MTTMSPNRNEYGMPVKVCSQPSAMTIQLTDPHKIEEEVRTLKLHVLRRAEVRRLHYAVSQSLDRSTFAAINRPEAVNNLVSASSELGKLMIDEVNLQHISVDSKAFSLTDVAHGPKAFRPGGVILNSFMAVWNGRFVMISYTPTCFVVCVMPES